VKNADVHAVLDAALAGHEANDKWADLVAAAVRMATAFYMFDEACKVFIASEKTRSTDLRL
jgi:hypothetical protein